MNICWISNAICNKNTGEIHNQHFMTLVKVCIKSWSLEIQIFNEFGVFCLLLISKCMEFIRYFHESTATTNILRSQVYYRFWADYSYSGRLGIYKFFKKLILYFYPYVLLVWITALILLWEHSHMTSDVFWVFLTYLL